MPNYADFKLGNLPKRSYFRQTPAIADFGEAWLERRIRRMTIPAEKESAASNYGGVVNWYNYRVEKRIRSVTSDFRNESRRSPQASPKPAFWGKMPNYADLKSPLVPI